MIHGTVVGLQARMSLIIFPPEHSSVEIECVIVCQKIGVRGW